MKTKKDSYTLASLEKLKEKINTRSDYQRPEVWRRAQKQLLIDSIMRGYDIPKIYVKDVENDSSQFTLEVIDGQQRLTAIWDFFDGEFGLPRDAEPIEGTPCASQSYEDLELNLRKHFDNYTIDFVVVTDAFQTPEKDEIGDLFLRLQNGTPLNQQEKRNAMPGKMRDFVKEISKHDFFGSCAFTSNRYGYDQVAAQLICLELSLDLWNIPTNIAAQDLDRMYKEQNNFDTHGKIANKVRKTFDYLHRSFPAVTPELAKHSVVTLYCIASRLINSYVTDETEKLLAHWFIGFEAERRMNDELEEDKKNTILLEYKNCISNSSDKQTRIEYRLKVMEEKFFEAHPDLKKKMT